MDNKDILFKSDNGIFSYRVAGILIKDKKVLLQRPIDEEYYAIPGGHVNFDETGEAALIREFKEETSFEVTVERLLWVGENFFYWGENKCHQIAFYYLLKQEGESLKENFDSFIVTDEVEREACKLEFSWVDISELKDIKIYPLDINEKLQDIKKEIEHFVYREEE